MKSPTELKDDSILLYGSKPTRLLPPWLILRSHLKWKLCLFFILFDSLFMLSLCAGLGESKALYLFAGEALTHELQEGFFTWTFVSGVTQPTPGWVWSPHWGFVCSSWITDVEFGYLSTPDKSGHWGGPNDSSRFAWMWCSVSSIHPMSPALITGCLLLQVHLWPKPFRIILILHSWGVIVLYAFVCICTSKQGKCA